MILKNKKLIIFDLGGTLIDSLPDIAIAINNMLLDIGKASYSDETIKKWLGNGLKMLVKRALTGTRDVDNDFNDSLFQTAFALFIEKYNEQNYKNTRLYPNVKTTLKILSERKFQMAVITNNPEQVVDLLLKQCGIESYFKIYLGSNSLPKKKPNALPLLHVCQQLQIKPENTVMVGDSKNDIIAAHSAGIESIGLTYGYNYGEDINQYHPTVITSNFKDILKILEVNTI